MNVVCLKWGDRYGADYVNKLYKGIIKRTPEAKLHCITDNGEGILEKVGIIPLEDQGLKGWWNKLQVFGVDLEGPVLYLDLDVLITGYVGAFFEHRPEEPFLGIQNFGPRNQTINSSVFRFVPKLYSPTLGKLKYRNGNGKPWDEWGLYGEYKGDQELIHDYLFKDKDFTQYLFPKDWVGSYKYNRGEKKPANKIVVFHGYPKPHDLNDWVKDEWI